MTHLSEKQLISLWMGENLDRAEAEAHLGECDACRREFECLSRVLDVTDLAVPERGASYGAEVWHRIEPLLPERHGFRWFGWSVPRLPGWAVAASMSALLALSFFAGHRFSIQQRATETAQQGGASKPERILVIAVGDYLDRSQMVLAEIANADAGKGKVDISEERQWAEDLVGENRLYRQTAQREGETNVAMVLDDLERVLLEIAHSPQQVSQQELEQIRQRIESQGILFKVRVIGSRLRERQRIPPVRRPGSAGDRVL